MAEEDLRTVDVESLALNNTLDVSGSSPISRHQEDSGGRRGERPRSRDDGGETSLFFTNLPNPGAWALDTYSFGALKKSKVDG